MTPRDHTPSFDHLIIASNLPRAEARRLLAHITGRPLTWFIAHGDDAVAPDTAAAFEALAARRRAGEPLAYLLGEQAFYGRQFGVSPAVLIPRADTETLIEAALEKRRMMGIGPVILELGTGSGIIAGAGNTGGRRSCDRALARGNGGGTEKCQCIGGARYPVAPGKLVGCAVNPARARHRERHARSSPGFWRPRSHGTCAGRHTSGITQLRSDRLQPALHCQRRSSPARRRPALRAFAGTGGRRGRAG